MIRNETTNITTIKRNLRNEQGSYYYDDCLSEILDIRPRQQVNQVCKCFKQKKALDRVKGPCDIASIQKFPVGALTGEGTFPSKGTRSVFTMSFNSVYIS